MVPPCISEKRQIGNACYVQQVCFDALRMVHNVIPAYLACFVLCAGTDFRVIAEEISCP